MKYRHRRAFSLLEILLATTILLGAIVVLGQLAHLGLRNAREASKMARAQQLCQNKLEGIVLGLEPPESIENVPFDEDPAWLYSIEMEPVEREGMMAVRVSVKEDLPEPSTPLEFSLVRWVSTAATSAEPQAGSAFDSALMP